jgi:penicillin-binding protein 1A
VSRRGRRRASSVRSSSRSQRWLLRWGWLLPVGALVIGGTILGLTYAFARIPLPRDIELASSAKVFDVKGRLIGTYSDEVRRFLIDTDELPKYVGEAVVASEDKDFYEHSGVSLRGIIRAGWANITGGEISQGGSTITQQYVKNAVLQDPSRTVTRKLKELVLAIKLERRYPKEQILGFYLNTIYLGRGAYGFEAAAQTYFDKAAKDLSLGEASYLAGIIPAPESYQPDENPRGAEARRDRVLDIMVDEGFITESAASKARREKIKIARGALGSVVKRQRAAYFLEWLRRDFLQPEFQGGLFTQGLEIHTTLDLDMQEAAEEAIASHLTEKSDPEAALVSMTPKGEVRALIGGRDFTNVKKARGFDFATDFPGRSAGSSFKPFTLLTAIEQDISTRSRFSGHSPQLISDPECANPDGTPWDVENYEGGSYGSMDLVQATTNSVNTIYAQLAAELGPDAIVETLDDFEFDRPGTDAERDLHSINLEVCSQALGTMDVTPLEMARSYAAFAGRGALPEVMPIRYIENFEGDCVKQYRPNPDLECGDADLVSTTPAAEQNDVDVLSQTLTSVVSSGTATEANIGRPVAGKTGTAQQHKDAWFAGYVPQLATVVWMGYPFETRIVDCVVSDPRCNKNGKKKEGYVPLMEFCSDLELCRPVHGVTVTGGSFPAQIWAAFMSVAVADMDVLGFPIPIDLPDEVINEAPVVSPKPKPSKTREEEPEPTPTPDDTAQPSPEPTDSGGPNPLPTNSGGNDDDEGG